jgi:hypothetical protein
MTTLRIPKSDQAVQFPVDVVMEKNYVDEVMCFMQGASKEAAIVRLGPVSMRMGVAGSCIAKPGKRLYALGDRKTEGQELIVAKVIEFYIPSNFHKRARWIPTEKRGKLIEFCLPEKTRPAKVIEVRHRLLLQRSQTGSDG